MEKLQAALATARKARSGEPVPSAEQVRTAAKRKRERSASGDIWNQLDTFEPPSSALKEHRVVSNTASNAATPFDILRTKIVLQMRQNNWTRLGITSPMPNSGKSTIACNLALGLGRQKEFRSMLFDLDLRDPSVAEFFAQEPEVGLSSVLDGQEHFEDQAKRIGDNLIVSMADRPESDPARIMLSERTVDTLDDIQRAYQPDLMIFDLPSVLVNDDTRAFLKNVDCALIVSRANKTRYSQFDICEREIAEHTNVLGVVLNAYRNADPVME